MAKRGAAVLEMPEPGYAPGNGTRSRAADRVRRNPVEDFADEYDAVPEKKKRPSAPRPTVKLKLGNRIRIPLPSTTAGLVATCVAMLLLLAAVFWLLTVTRAFLLHDARFRLANGSSIEIEGNHHLRRAQLLGLFSDDMERNIFRVSLEQRQADLEVLPWVQRATVMRLLPGRLRVSLVERTPVAFVRQGVHIGLVDANGVLLDMAAGPQAEHYSFPVVTGIAPSDPMSTRAARMRIFERFTKELDAGGAKNAESVSEIDLSNPEDVKALVEQQGATVLVHFGEGDFLARYQKVKELLPQWHAQYPNLASADMRYEHEIPLAMASAKAAAPAIKPPAKVVAAAPVAHDVPGQHPALARTTPAKPVVHAALKPPPVVHPVDHPFVPAPGVKPWQPSAAVVPPVQAPSSSASSVSAAARSLYATKAPLTKTAVVTPPKAAAIATTKPSASAVHQGPAVVAVKHGVGKPSAGKPLLPNDTNPSPQAAQR